MVNANLTNASAADRPGLCMRHFAAPRQALDVAIKEWARFPVEGADWNLVAPSPQLVGHHTTYMWPVTMLQYLNGSTGLNWLFTSDCKSNPRPSPSPSPGGSWHCVDFSQKDLAPCVKLPPAQGPACQSKICTGSKFHGNFTHGEDGTR
jgi:hypothetical protein